MSNLELLEKRIGDDDKANRLIQGAIQGAQRGATLTQRMLAFARRQELKPDVVDVPKLVGGMTDLLRRTLGPTIEITAALKDGLAPVLMDPGQLELALLNLAVNARDAMPDGGRLTIEASLRAVRGGHRSGLARGRYLRLAVADTGTGMDEATLARAIEPFFSTKGIGKGTGLGLYLARELCLNNNAKLDYEYRFDAAAMGPRSGEGARPFRTRPCASRK